VKDSNGKILRVGDRVKLWNQTFGKVVCDFDHQNYSESFTHKNWAHLKIGILIEKDDQKLIYYPDSDEDLEIITQC
jgi:hypothetical protein